MIMNLAQMQYIQKALNYVSATLDTKYKYVPVFKLDNHMMTAEFFTENENGQPTEICIDNGNYHETNDIYQNLKLAITQAYLDFNSVDSFNKNIIENPRLLFKWLISKASSVKSKKTIQSELINVKFFDNSKLLEFMDVSNYAAFDFVSLLRVMK
ncbi:hypothetical protein LNP07_04725 [Apilactobacillus sp. M161]|uniref:Uncharacterized protein n=1 Tax=Apilactobacillus xinyiensis TaxID=2841032 RepID=A0ABT0I283_9LACO|nr:hypothetical protein [Apilactobacillus xinyiensis]MCK8624816.1 hypothetical protein [Apilactobacillus xinyiensis]